jgi:hypothetical protein
VSRENRFFDLTQKEVAELGIVVAEADEGFQVGSNSGPIFTIKNPTDPDEQRPVNAYTTFLAQTAHVAERDTCRVVAPISDRTLGYVFPIAAFRDPENFEGIWLKRFADVSGQLFRLKASPSFMPRALLIDCEVTTCISMKY